MSHPGLWGWGWCVLNFLVFLTGYLTFALLASIANSALSHHLRNNSYTDATSRQEFFHYLVPKHRGAGSDIQTRLSECVQYDSDVHV